MNIAILIFDGAEELDFVGPWEVFTVAAAVIDAGREQAPVVYLVSERGGLITCAKGMRVASDFSFATAPAADVILVPGGLGTRRELTNPSLLAWIASQSAGCRWTTSVCTGSMLLAAAGPARGHRITTHWRAVPEAREKLAAIGCDVNVVEGVRWVVDGSIVTSAGISAGIDMTLWLVGQIYGEALGRAVTQHMEYDPAPPFALA
ncbi:MAG: DJ-1/PfpI family protein [Rhodospirillaceae bacterium]|nr:MAG: DJ-1/PfpI family protein [Rhodospirillaceae bacterium]